MIASDLLCIVGMSIEKYFLKYGHHFFKTRLVQLKDGGSIMKASDHTAGLTAPSKGSVLYVQKGNLFQYEHIRERQSFYDQVLIRLVDYDIVNLVHYFGSRPSTVRASYCTPLHFDDVEAVPRVRDAPLAGKDVYSAFYNQHNFVIRNTYLDLHPLDIYVKLSKLYGLKFGDFIKMFQLSFSESPLAKNVFYPELKDLNDEVLEKGQQKLRILVKKKYGDNMSKEEDIERKARLRSWESVLEGMMF
jgi:hypothetical protein